MEKWGELGAGEGGRAGANEMKKFPVRECVGQEKNKYDFDGWGDAPSPNAMTWKRRRRPFINL